MNEAYLRLLWNLYGPTVVLLLTLAIDHASFNTFCLVHRVPADSEPIGLERCVDVPLRNAQHEGGNDLAYMFQDARTNGAERG